MAEVVVKIEVHDDGTVLVGRVPEAEEQAADKGGEAPAASAQSQAAQLMGGGQPAGAAQPQGEAEEGAEAPYMKPVRSIDEALAMAKQMLSQGQGANQDEQMAQGFGGGGAPPAMAGRRMGMGA